MEKMKGYAESFPPAPSSRQELPALTTSTGQAVLGCRVSILGEDGSAVLRAPAVLSSDL